MPSASVAPNDIDFTTLSRDTPAGKKLIQLFEILSESEQSTSSESFEISIKYLVIRSTLCKSCFCFSTRTGAPVNNIRQDIVQIARSVVKLVLFDI